MLCVHPIAMCGVQCAAQAAAMTAVLAELCMRSIARDELESASVRCGGGGGGGKQPWVVVFGLLSATICC